MLVSWDTDLVQIVENMIGGHLEALLLMAPSWRSTDGQWRTYQVTQIWRAYDADRSDETVIIFTTADGTQVQGQLAEKPADSVHGHELLVTVGKPSERTDTRAAPGHQ